MAVRSSLKLSGSLGHGTIAIYARFRRLVGPLTIRSQHSSVVIWGGRLLPCEDERAFEVERGKMGRMSGRVVERRLAMTIGEVRPQPR